MAEYIEREALLAKSKPFRLGQGEQWTGGGIPRFIGENDVKNAPAADVAPVVHGKWVNIQGGFWRVGTCSVCGEHYPTGGSNYCPNCGAKMDGGKENVQET